MLTLSCFFFGSRILGSSVLLRRENWKKKKTVKKMIFDVDFYGIFGVSVVGCFEKKFWISKNIIDKSEFYSEVFGWKTNLWIFQLGLIKDNLCILAPRKCSLECGAFFFFLESDHSHFPPPTETPRSIVRSLHRHRYLLVHRHIQPVETWPCAVWT